MSDLELTMMRRVGELNKENARLKAEVERLTPLLGDIVSFDEYHKLLQQVERLTKAGNAMAEDLLKEFGRKEMLKYQPYQDWNAAKEGKGQP
jgi:hypothetical protein